MKQVIIRHQADNMAATRMDSFRGFYYFTYFTE